LNVRSSKLDSLSVWIEIGQNEDNSKEFRTQNLIKAFDALMYSNDSLRIKKMLKIVDNYYSLEDYFLFNKANNDVYKISLKEKDTQSIAEFHWNKGMFLDDQNVLDSAYYYYNKTRFFYEKVGNKYYAAKMQFNMSFIQFRVKNYVESEVLVIKAIKTFEELNRDFNLYLSYNRLLLLDKEIGNYESAYEHFSKANMYLNRLDSKRDYQEKILNNLSLIYQKQGNYDLAIATLNKALENPDLQEKNYNLYGKIIDNRTYCQFLRGDTLDVLNNFNKALEIRKELENEAGIGISKLHLSEYFLKYKDSTKARTNAEDAYEIASKFHFNRDILVSLDLLSKTDPENAHLYMDQYITLNDSLLLEERKIRDKFTRIQFETEGYILANEELKERNVWISVSSIFALASLTLLFLVYRQKSKNKTLMFERQQHNANEEIYNLMLKQQSRTEEGRIQERLRISEELHDGILAKLFSVRIGMGVLFLKNEEKGDFKHEVFMKELQVLEKEIRTLSHALKDDELSAKKDFPILLQELLEEQSKLGGFVYQLHEDESIAWDNVEEEIKINLYRIAQESIHNILKYAKCTEVIISLEKKDNLIEMKIKDDGIGFDVNKKKKGIGLKNMKSRVKSIGAMVNIMSKPNQGTIIKITIPTKILYHEQKEQSTDY